MAGQDLIAKVRVETGPAEEQLKAFLGKTRTLTVNVKANTGAIEKSVGALKSVESAGKAAQEAVTGKSKGGKTTKTPDYITKAKKELIELTKLQNSLGARQKTLQNGLSKKSGSLLTDGEVKGIQKELSQIQSAMKQIDSLKGELNNIKNGKISGDKSSSVLTQSRDAKLESQQILADTKNRIGVIKEMRDVYKQLESDKSKAAKSDDKLQKVQQANINKANSELTAQMRIQNQLESRKKVLTDGLSNESAGLFKDNDLAKVAGQVREINNALAQNKSIQSDLRNAKNLSASHLSSVLETSRGSKEYSNQVLADTKSGVNSVNQVTAAYKEMQKSQEDTRKSAEKLQNNVIGFDKIGNRLSEYYNQYGSQIQKNIGLYNQFMTLMNKAQNGEFASVQEANRAFAQFRMQCRGAGVEVESIGSKLERTFGARVRSALAGQGVYMIQRSVQEILSNALEFDKAFTELKKVTNATDARYTQFVEDAKTRAVDLKTSLSDVVSSAADFARLGYDIPQAEEVSKAAIVYSRVGDGVKDIDQASSSLISTMQAFKIPASDVMTIVDKQHCPLKIA